MRRQLCLLMTCPLALHAASAAQPAQNSDPIVVTGKSLEKARKESYTFLRELGVVRGEKQAARWLIPICPKVVGISKNEAEQARAQIRATAKRIRAPLAPENCKANMVVVLTNHPKSFVQRIAREDRRKLPITPRKPDRDFLFGEAPARWWYDTGIRSRNNTQTQSEPGPYVVASTDGSVDGSGANNRAEVPGSTETVASSEYGASLLWTPTVRAISAATIIINIDEANRYGLEAVIDYATLVGLAEVRADASPDASILGLFAPGSVLRELSNRDVNFLTALYRISMDREANLQRTSLIRHMIESN